MKKSLEEIYSNHKGKLSDKWTFYINEWDKIFFPYRDKEINLLEIGVHNGGSLEIWMKYFSNAKHIIGCDIAEVCGKLNFQDQRISVIIGDANSNEVENQILRLTSNLDIIIDDGSHKSDDVIRSFSRYLKLLTNNGLYIIEDLHASYWKEFEGGLYYPYSAISFIKKLVDVTNFEHWRNNESRLNFLSPYIEHYDLELNEFDLCKIHSINILNSLCIISMKSPKENVLGNRIVVGSEEIVSQNDHLMNGITIHDIATDVQDDSTLNIFSLLNHKNRIKKELTDRDQIIKDLQSSLTKLDQKIQQLSNGSKQKDQDIERLKNKLIKKEVSNKLLNTDIKAKQKAIKQLEMDLTQHTKIIYELRSNLEQSEQRIQQLIADLNNKEKKSKQRSSDLAQKNIIIDQFKEDFEEQKRFIQELELNVENRDQTIMQLSANITQKNQIIEKMQANLAQSKEDALYFALSKSWKFTRPFRKLKKFLSERHDD
mgnify:CR=1 FL=1